jgi:hypothetical protein
VTTDNWVTIAGFTTAGSLVAIGWFVTGHLNRAKEVVLKRLEYRLKALHDCQFCLQQELHSHNLDSLSSLRTCEASSSYTGSPTKSTGWSDSLQRVNSAICKVRTTP